MKYALPLLAAAAAVFLPAPARADAWADYSALMNRYYLIDREENTTITCRISSSAFEQLMHQAPAASTMIQEAVERFRVSVHPDGQITFETPYSHIEQGPYEAAEELSSVLTKVIGGVEQVVHGVLEGLVSEQRDNLKDLSVTAKGGQTMVSFSHREFDGTPAKVEVLYSGDTDATREETAQGITNSTTKYTVLNGKLAISASKARREGTDGFFDGGIQVEYQKVGNTYFPESIITDFQFGPKHMPEHLKVEFNDCTQ